MRGREEEVLIVDNRDGFKLYEHKRYKKIVRIDSGSFSIRVGQWVQASGRYLVPRGTNGIVTAIVLPYENRHTSNVIAVWFEGCHTSNFVKFEDLEIINH